MTSVKDNRWECPFCHTKFTFFKDNGLADHLYHLHEGDLKPQLRGDTS